MPPPTIPVVSVNIQSHSGAVVYRNLVINQVVNGHHQFSFIWNIGELSHDSSSQLDVIRTNIGSMVTIQIDDYNFKGIITQISVHEQTDRSQSFTVKGQSLTILLDDVPHSATYYKKELKKIVKTTLEGIPSNVMETDIHPKSSVEHHYITQYNETDFQFLQRLAIRYGEWFYYDGTALKFGQTGDASANLRSGSNLTSYSVKANLIPSRYSYMSYDYNTGDTVKKELPSFASSVHNDFSSAAADKSGEVYTRTTDRPMHNFNLLNKNMMDSVAELEMQRLAAQLLFAKGDSKHPALRPGYKFVVETANGNYDYVATHVTHMSNQTGHYENTFQGVPFSVEVPPYTNPHTFRQASAQSGIVKENHDADGLNRIKVHFAWQRSADMTPWIRVATPTAGGDKGWHFIPEKNEEVIIDFDGGDVDKPYMVAAHFHGKAKSKISDADNNIKSLITKSGNTVTLNDKEGSITITDPKGSTIILKGDETIEIKSKKKIIVQSKDIEFNADNDIMLNAKNNISLKATKDVVFDAQGSLTAKAMKALSLKSSTDKVTVEGLQDVAVTSGAGAVKIEAMTEFKAKGTVGATVEGLKLDLKGTAMASLQAALVKINLTQTKIIMESISATVGARSTNNKADVKLIQRLINSKDCSPAFSGTLQVDGDCGQKTVTAIKQIQKFLKSTQDGFISPNGPTFRYLMTFTQLPLTGVGYRIYGSSSNQYEKAYGTIGTIVAIQSIARIFNDAQSNVDEVKRISIQIGDISYSNGKVMSPHSSHRKGVDVDIRPIRKDNTYAPVSITDSEYDRERTKTLIEVIKKYTITEAILFNDSAIPGVTYYSGHHNHIHVKFKL